MTYRRNENKRAVRSARYLEEDLSHANRSHELL